MSVITAFSSYSQAGTIKGSLLDKKSGKSIVNTKIKLLLNDSIIKTTTTDSEGFFIINGLEPKKYRARIIVNNYREIQKKKVFVEDVRTCYLFLKLEAIKGLNEN